MSELYKLDIDGGRNGLYGLADKYPAGIALEFRVPLPTDTDTTVASDDVDLLKDYEGWELRCRFIMPAHDVSITISQRNTMTMNVPPGTSFVGMTGILTDVPCWGAMPTPPSADEDLPEVVCPFCGNPTKAPHFCPECGGILKR